MRENDQRKLKMRLKMTSNVGITVFTLIGSALYLITFLGVALTTPKPMPFWQVLIGAIGGTAFIGAIIVVILRFFRFFLTGKKE